MCGCTCCGRPALDRPVREPTLDRAHADPRAVAADEQRRRVRARQRRADAEPGADRLARGGADRHDALLRALAPYAHLAVVDVDAIDVEPGELGQPQARRVGELEQRAIADRRTGRRRESSTSRTACSGESAEGSRRADFGARSPAHGLSVQPRVALDGEAIERAPRRQHPREAAAREPATVQRGEKAPQLRRREAGQVGGRRRAPPARARRADTRSACAPAGRRDASRSRRARPRWRR